jgi:hypothetical protein
MLIISRQQVEELIRKLNDPAKLDESREEIKRMLEIKSALLWKAEPGTCCGSLEEIRTCLASEVQILEETLAALDKGNIPQASSLLTEYTKYLAS